MKKSDFQQFLSISRHSMPFFFGILFIVSLASMSMSNTNEYTRGVGVYPGDSREDFSPAMRTDNTNYRNLALRRPVIHSSCYDYNLTAQLVTDGIRDTALPAWVSVSTSRSGSLNKNEREWILDRTIMTAVTLEGSSGWVQFEICGSGKIPEADSVNVSGSLLVNELEAKGWNCVVSGSDDGKAWEEMGRAGGDGLPGEMLPEFFRRFMPKNLRFYNFPIRLSGMSAHRYHKFELSSPNVDSWKVAEAALFKQKKRIEIGGPYNFTSAWMGSGNGEEWVYVDLGASCSFDRVVLYWIRRAAEGSVQVSDDANHWKDIRALPGGTGQSDDFVLDKQAKARYVRVLMKRPASSEGYILGEMEVYGRGGPVAVPHPAPAVRNDGRMELAGGGWRIQRASLVQADGETLSKPGFHDESWVVATVPGTALVSYLNAGALPDPNFGDNQLMVSESFFYSDFWYRTEFTPPVSYDKNHVQIHFDGINWKADVYLNGCKLGRIEGAFMRGKFDADGVLIPGQKNVLAVRIEKNATPGFATEQTKMSADANGGELGADNPTFHASIGWDWIPTIRGRNIGIWNDVYLTAGGPVTLENPFVITDLPLPDTSSADVIVEVSLQNHESGDVTGRLTGKFGDIEFGQDVALKQLETKKIRLDPTTNPNLRIKNPRLWWPNGYGKPDLYPVDLQFVVQNGRVSDMKSFKTGIRELAYSEDGGALRIWINGRRFIGRGGNWGFSESNLCYRGREYDTAVRYHRGMNFTLIRNWVGQTGDDEFYEACDRYGVMVWQDFWLANPLDGPNPTDNELFLRNAEDMVLRIRNHPSIALYCGRNEGNPPDPLDAGIRKILAGTHPGLHYISNSAFGVVSGGGPYRAMPVKYYFENRATTKIHSELGMPNVVNFESLRKMMPDSAFWPIGRMWGIHDFCLEGAQGGASFVKQIDESLGEADNVRDWISSAQWANYQGYRAMFEAQSKNRMGLLLWMSHPAWPSLVWQTYDYYFEPTAAYFGCKKASEPLHIQWNPLSDSVEVVNYSDREGFGLTASVKIFNMDGKVQWEKDVSVTCHEDSTARCIKMEYPSNLTPVHFLSLKLMRGGQTVSDNFYWRGLEEGNFKAVRKLPKVKLDCKTQIELKGSHWLLTTRLINPSEHPVLMVRLKVVGEKSGDLILPVLYGDNYVSLMPGEERTILMELEHADTHGEKPLVQVEGFNAEKSME